ncbi:MAG: hypothetical protein JWL90_156 [Chthoniobacteraceae bacterium]|nr:hypothetical protein [Chthoniobacteraceae bacterium]
MTQLAGRHQLDTRRRGDAGKMFVPSGKTSTFSSGDCLRWKPFGKNFLETNFLGCRARFIASGWSLARFPTQSIVNRENPPVSRDR